MKTEVQSNNPHFKNAFFYLIEQANQELLLGPYSVTQKTKRPPSHNMHDYFSLARYYWPNPFDPKDPYIRKDCETNPEILTSSYDYHAKNRFVRASILLSLAYYLTDDEAYAKKAICLLKTWFLDPSFRMNPHLQFAQTIPGKTNDNPFGIIEGHIFPFVFEASYFLQNSPFWYELEGIEEWAKKYLDWLLTSPQGKKEQKTLNNHASWYDFQTIYFALYTKQETLAFDLLKNRTYPKFKSHFLSDGSLPKELIRKKGIYYSLFNLQAFFYTALLAQKIGIDLWHIEEKEKPILQKGLDFLLPKVSQEEDSIELYPLLLIGSSIYNSSSYFFYYEQLEDQIWHYDETTRQLSFKILKLLYPKAFFH